MNRLRIPLVRDVLTRQKAALSKIPSETDDSATPLKGLMILDVGCGGGILSEPLARLGAEVTGIDASAEIIKVAKWHAELDPSITERLSYRNMSVEELCKSDGDSQGIPSYDGVVASEIIEHVSDVELFVNACCSLVKPGGSIFFTTINRTLCSYALAIILAEYLLGIVAPGVHDWNKFVVPEELQSLLSKNGFSTRLIHGLTLNPITKKWYWISNTSVDYALHAVKSTDNLTV